MTLHMINLAAYRSITRVERLWFLSYLEDRNLLKLRSLDSLHSPQAILVFGDNEPKCSKCYDRKDRIALRTSKCCNR